MAKRTTTVGEIGFEVAKPTIRRQKKVEKVENPKLNIIEEYGLPTDFKDFNNFEILDILYYLAEEEPEITIDLNKIQKITDLPFYKHLEANKKMTEYYVRFSPKSEHAKNIKCPRCGNMGADLLPPMFRSMDEAPLRFYRCTSCKIKFN